MFEAVTREGSTCNSIHCFNTEMRKQVKGKKDEDTKEMIPC
jgi:hypothetical protein